MDEPNPWTSLGGLSARQQPGYDDLEKRYSLRHDAIDIEVTKRDGDAFLRLDDEDVDTAGVAWIQTRVVGRGDCTVASSTASIREPTTCSCARCVTVGLQVTFKKFCNSTIKKNGNVTNYFLFFQCNPY